MLGLKKGIIFLSVEYAAILSIEYEAFLKIGTNMSESFEWHSFLESVEDLCRQVEHRIQLSDLNTLQDFLFRLQAKRTACERLIGASLASGVDTSVSDNVQGEQFDIASH